MEGSVGSVDWNERVSLKGNTYWLASDGRGDSLVNFILRFDFTTVTFGRLPLPFESDGDPDLVAALSVVREEKLAVLHQPFENFDFKMKIWLANTKTDDAEDYSWSEFLEVDFDELGLNGMTRVMSFLVDEENKTVMCCDKDDEDGGRTRLYIAGEDIYKQVYREPTRRPRSLDPLLVSYVPTLVQIPAMQRSPGGRTD
ncbi:putative F-box/kelch-repeat protein At3g17570 [Eutrema salsugineum]|uniref:putative F-box/kelch-repeat protein At3g17570 n=1 Tax=Eutrema salsugineum TaxID=72664 RepID=UPI000CED7BF2|nr:putative F-box/kelch-repeat protein At3g17570 [Eutrema salsugineum]